MGLSGLGLAMRSLPGQLATYKFSSLTEETLRMDLTAMLNSL